MVYEYSGETDINLAEGVKINERSIPENIREQLIKETYLLQILQSRVR